MHCCGCQPASSTPKGSRPTSSSSTVNLQPRSRGVRAAPAFKALDLRPANQQTLHPQRDSLKRTDLDDFVSCYNPKNRHERKPADRFRSFSYEELTKRDKLNLDIFWLKDDSLEDSANLPPPDVIAAEIVEDLQAALAQFAEIASDLKK
jgi:type I restriction enzyme M protein